MSTFSVRTRELLKAENRRFYRCSPFAETCPCAFSTIYIRQAGGRSSSRPAPLQLATSLLRSQPCLPLTWSVSWSLILVGHRSSRFFLNRFRHDSNVRFCFSMSGFLPSQILGWHSATGPATTIVKRFKLYMTSNADTRAVSNKTKSLIQERNVYEGREKPVTMRFLRLAWFRADRVSPRKVV